MPRDKQIMVNLEEPLYQAAALASDKDASRSMSGYCRRLIIRDLRQRGLLTPELMQLVLES